MSSSMAMGRGLDDIRQIFIAECIDGLAVIESGLLDLEKGTDSQETINDIFRGAHSIKGGAATFGYSNIAEFTHVMETLLDKLREHELSITPAIVKVFLDSVDCLRDMVDTMDSDSGSYDRERTAEIQAKLTAFLESDGSGPQEELHDVAAIAAELGLASAHVPQANGAAKPAASPAQGGKIWDIHFRPKPEFLKNGNQPQHIFRALGELGKCEIVPDLSQLPPLAELKVNELHLNWKIALHAETTEEHIREVFDWVELDCDISIALRSDDAADEERHDEHEHEHALAGEKHVELAEHKADRKAGSAHKKDSGSIRVDIEKIDVLLNLVGEMVINQAMLNQLARNKNNAQNGTVELEQALALLERTTRELQEAVMEIRMLPVSVTFSRFPRLVYDLSSKLNKKVELKITGEQTEVDKTVLEKIGDPLLHLIRNSLDHGIESPQARLQKGKSETGTVHLSASHEGGSVVIRVSDDGGGLNTAKILQKAVEKKLVADDAKLSEAQIHDLIFRPGFSTADVVTDVSGRGVGMDVVRRNIEDIGGRVEVYSVKDKGSTFQITLPLTLAILDGQLIKVANEVYVLPLLSIVETVSVEESRINIISGKEIVYRLRGEAVPVVDMRRVCRIDGNDTLASFAGKQLIIVEAERKHIGLVVDELLDQHQVVIKSLETNFVKVPGMLGATILGDGTVSLILDVTTLAELIVKENAQQVRH
jgi:two-component system, chemotaxis family, sensor kinase CheA